MELEYISDLVLLGGFFSICVLGLFVYLASKYTNLGSNVAAIITVFLIVVFSHAVEGFIILKVEREISERKSMEDSTINTWKDTIIRKWKHEVKSAENNSDEESGE